MYRVGRVETKGEHNGLRRLRQCIKELKIAYAELSIDFNLSQKVIEKSDEMFGLDLKKLCTSVITEVKG